LHRTLTVEAVPQNPLPVLWRGWCQVKAAPVSGPADGPGDERLGCDFVSPAEKAELEAAIENQLIGLRMSDLQIQYVTPAAGASANKIGILKSCDSQRVIVALQDLLNQEREITQPAVVIACH